jgi:hypothetical protein
MKEKTFLFIFHKPLDQVDGQTRYIKELIDVISSTYTITIPSELFYSNSKWKNRNWILRTTLINLYLIKWIFSNRRSLKKKFDICIVEDRYTLFPAFLIILLSKVKLISRLSDWGKRYVDSLNLNGTIPKYIVNLLDHIYAGFVLRYSFAIIVPSDYTFVLVKEKFNGMILNFPLPFSPNILKESDKLNRIEVHDNEHDIYCVLVGNFNYRPNEDSANFIVKELAPEVKKRDKRIKFLLVGICSKEKFSQFDCENTLAVGVLDNLHDFYKQCQIGINPSQTVGGTSIKNIEYLTNGLLVVSTEEAAAGVIKSSHLFMEKREGFLELILDLANKIRSGKNITDEKETERIKKYYSKKEIKKNTLAFLDEISKKSH